MNLEALELFIAVSNAGNLASAARERDVDPSSVSRTISGLEAELGVRLFHRTTRSLSLTEAGTLYRARVEPLVEEIRRAATEAANASAEPRGTLRLTASVAFGTLKLAPLLGAFRSRYPLLKLECMFTDSNLDLTSERIDLAIRQAPSIEGDLIATKLAGTRYRVVASPEYVRHALPLEKPSDLKDHRCLLLGLRPFRTSWKFRDVSGQIEEVAIDGDVVVSAPLALRAVAVSGAGPALLSDILIEDDLAQTRLVDLFPEYRCTATTFDTAVWAVYPSRTYLPNKVRVMIDFLKNSI